MGLRLLVSLEITEGVEITKLWFKWYRKNEEESKGLSKKSIFVLMYLWY